MPVFTILFVIRVARPMPAGRPLELRGDPYAEINDKTAPPGARQNPAYKPVKLFLLFTTLISG